MLSRGFCWQFGFQKICRVREEVSCWRVREEYQPFSIIKADGKLKSINCRSRSVCAYSLVSRSLEIGTRATTSSFKLLSFRGILLENWRTVWRVGSTIDYAPLPSSRGPINYIPRDEYKSKLSAFSLLLNGLKRLLMSWRDWWSWLLFMAYRNKIHRSSWSL